MITNDGTEKSARKWAEQNTPDQVNYTTRQLMIFLAECSMRDGALWLHAGWAPIWSRVLENLEDEESPRGDYSFPKTKK